MRRQYYTPTLLNDLLYILLLIMASVLLWNRFDLIIEGEPITGIQVLRIVGNTLGVFISLFYFWNTRPEKVKKYKN